MVTDWPSCLPISAIVVIGGDMISVMEDQFRQAVSSLSNVGCIFSIGFTLSSCSISRSSGGVFGALRNNSMASFQLTEPSPGHKKEAMELLRSAPNTPPLLLE